MHPQTEEYRGNVNPPGPRACSNEGKRYGETLFFDYLRQYKIPIRAARTFNTYGPRMRPGGGRVVSNIIVQILRGEDIMLFGDGSQTRAFCYVDDLVGGLTRLMATANEFTEPIDIGNPHEISVGELAERVIRLTGSRSRTVFGPRPQDDPTQRYPNISLAQRFLGWQSTVNLADGLLCTIGYFERKLIGQVQVGTIPPVADAAQAATMR